MTKRRQRVVAAAALVGTLVVGTVGVAMAQEDPGGPAPATADEAWARVDGLKVQIEEAFAGAPPSDEERTALIHDVSEAIYWACEVDPDHPNCT